MSSEITEAYAEAFDAKREVFLGARAVLVLLKPDMTPSATPEHWTIDDEDRNSPLVILVADVSAEFAAVVRETAFAVIRDSSRGYLNDQLYATDGNTKPDGFKGWRIGFRSEGRRLAP